MKLIIDNDNEYDNEDDVEIIAFGVKQTLSQAARPPDRPPVMRSADEDTMCVEGYIMMFCN